jgi:hypothetical protein
MPDRAQHRLAAILAADMVGYSRLIGQDEAGTLRRLKELRRTLTTQRYWGVGLDPPETGDIDKRADLVPRIVEAGNKAVEFAPASAEAHLALRNLFCSL